MTLKHITAAVAVAALVVPTAATADSGKGKGASGDAPATTQAKGKAKAKGHGKAKNAVFKGTVVSIDLATGSVVVKVSSTNKWGRPYKNTDVTFTTATVKKIGVADTNADSKTDLMDVKVGDKVQVQAKIKKDAVAPFAARKFKVYAPEAPEPAPAPAPAP
jgi:hypothetical protein